MSETPDYSQPPVNTWGHSARTVAMIRIWMKIAENHSQCTYDSDLARGCHFEILPQPLKHVAGASGTRKTSARVYSLGLAYLTDEQEP